MINSHKKKLIIFSLLLSSLMTFGQQNELPYMGGPVSLYRHFTQQIAFKDRSNIGVAILAWEVSNGEIKNSRLLNSINYVMDRELIRILEMTAGHWLAVDSTYNFRLPVIFKSIDMNFFVDPFPNNYLSEVVVVGYNMGSFLSDDKLISKLNKHITNGKFEKAVEILNEIVKRNPFNKQIRETRIYCNKKLGRTEFVCEDVLFIKNELHTQSQYKCEKP